MSRDQKSFNTDDTLFCVCMVVVSIWLFWSFAVLQLAKLGFIDSARNYSDGEIKVIHTQVINRSQAQSLCVQSSDRNYGRCIQLIVFNHNVFQANMSYETMHICFEIIDFVHRVNGMTLNDVPTAYFELIIIARCFTSDRSKATILY